MKTILFADDNRNIREYCRATLEDDGYRVVVACDGFGRNPGFRGGKPRSGGSGYQYAENERPGSFGADQPIAPQVPVILFSAHGEDCLRDRRASFATACVKKGDDLGELKRVIADTLNGAEPPVGSGSGSIGCCRLILSVRQH